MGLSLAFRPKLLESLRGYTRDDFRADLVAGITVGLVALPLGMALATGVEAPSNAIAQPIRQYQIRFAPGPRLLAAGVDPLLILRTIKQLGTASVEAEVSKIPALAELDPSVCHISWTIALEIGRAHV